MSRGRSKLNEQDEQVLDDVKRKISTAIALLRENGVRDINIEIELIWHIKKELKGE